MLSANYCRKHIKRLTKCLFDLSDKSKEYLIAILVYFMAPRRNTKTIKENIKILTSCSDVPMLSKKTT